jgi:hypothetical protein
VNVDTRAPVYLENDLVVYRASKLGLCLRALAAARQGCPPVPPSAKHQADMEAGQAYESIVLARLAAMGHDVSWCQQEHDLPVAEGIIVRAHIDGVVTRISQAGTVSYVTEVKALAPSTFRAWRARGFQAFPVWAWQLAVGMHATGLSGLMAVADRTSGVLSLLEVERPPRTMLEIERRVAQAEELAATGSLGECPEAFPCFWFYAHEVPVLTPEATPEHVRVVLREARQKASGALLERVEERLREVGEL